MYVLLEQFGVLCGRFVRVKVTRSPLPVGVVPGVTVTPAGPSLDVYSLVWYLLNGHLS